MGDKDDYIMRSLELLKTEREVLRLSYNNVVQEYENKIEIIENSISKIDETIQLLEEIHESRLKIYASEDLTTTIFEPKVQVTKRYKVKNLSSEIRKVSQRILEAAVRPMDRNELCDNIIKSGLVLDSTNPAQLVGMTMWRCGLFVTTNEGFWPLNRPLPPGVHLRKQKIG